MCSKDQYIYFAAKVSEIQCVFVSAVKEERQKLYMTWSVLM